MRLMEVTSWRLLTTAMRVARRQLEHIVVVVSWRSSRLGSRWAEDLPCFITVQDQAESWRGSRRGVDLRG